MAPVPVAEDASAGVRRLPAWTITWMILGALWSALFFYCMIAWVLGSDFVPNTFGRDKAPADYVRFIKTIEIVMVVLTAWIVWQFIVRPFVRDGKLSFEGLYFLACGTLVVQEPWHAWIRPQLLYNTIFFNYGSWLGYLPMSNPTAFKTPLPIAFAGLGYFWIYGLPAFYGARLMLRARMRNPALTPARLGFYAFLGFCVFDQIIENIILRTGMFIYPSTIPELTFFAGETYQFPIYETFSWAGSYTVAACLLCFRNQAGESWPERGLAALGSPGIRQTFLRWLALAGALQVGLLATFNLPYMFWALHGGKFTVTEESHPWLTAGLCGTSTPYACPGPGVPFARKDSSTNRMEAP